MDSNISLSQLHKRHIRGTQPKAIVADRTILLCNLTNAVVKATGDICPKVYINTRILKHLYDKRPAEEYECVLQYMINIVKFPLHIYANKDAKTGDFCFVKTIQNVDYIATIEHQPEVEMCNVVTCFRLRKRSYLNGYNLLWSWKGGTPSS